MKNSDSREISNSSIKDHSEILQIIDEIRAYEQSFTDIKPEIIEELEDVKQDLIEVEHEEIIAEEVVPNEEIAGVSKKKFGFLKGKKEPKPRVHTTFRMGFNEGGSFVNLDFKQPTSKEPSKLKGKINLKKIMPFRKKGNDSKNDDSESSSKLSKIKGLKGGLGKLGKLKKVIPNRKSSSEESKEEK